MQLTYIKSPINKQLSQENPNCLFLVDDNFVGYSYDKYKTELLNIKNVYGIPIRWMPLHINMAMFKDHQLSDFMFIIDNAFNNIPLQYDNIIVWYDDSGNVIATGLAQQCPKCFEYLLSKLEQLQHKCDQVLYKQQL